MNAPRISKLFSRYRIAFECTLNRMKETFLHCDPITYSVYDILRSDSASVALSLLTTNYTEWSMK